jgi:predicted RNA methylase
VNQKEFGAYYTPKPLTSFIAEKTIHSYLYSKIDNKYETITSFLNLSSLDELADFYFFELCSLSVLDNAVGAGAFLIAAEKVLFELYSTCFSRLVALRGSDIRVDQEFNTLIQFPSKNYFFHYKIITQNLFGVDIDHQALDLCKKRLLNSLISEIDSKATKSINLPKLKNIKVGNSLIGFIVSNREILCHILDKSLLERLEAFLERFSYLSDQKNPIHSKKKILFELEEFRCILNKEFQKFYLQKSNNKETEATNLNPFHWFIEFHKPMMQGGFDIIIGNPPWGATLSKNNLRFLAKQFNLSQKNLNSFILFIRISMVLLRCGGILTYIIPKNFIKTNDYVEMRRFILDRYSILRIVDIGTCFDGVAQEAVILSLKKQPSSDPELKTVELYTNVDQNLDYLKNRGYTPKFCSQQFFRSLPDNVFAILLNETIIPILRKILIDSTPLSTYCTVVRGIETGKEGRIVECTNLACKRWFSPPKKILSNGKKKKCPHCNTEILILPSQIQNFLSTTADSSYTSPVFVGEQLCKYRMRAPFFLISNLPGINYKETKINYKAPKILLLRISQWLKAALDESGSYALKTLYVLNLKPSYDIIDLKYILGLLNSSILQFLYEVTQNMGSSLTPSLTQKNILQFPIKNLPRVQRCEIAAIVDEILSGELSKIQILEDKLFSLYKLSNEERHQIITLNLSYAPKS